MAAPNDEMDGAARARKQRAIELHKSGMLNVQIARELGVHVNTVRKYLRGQKPNTRNPRAVAARQESRRNPQNDIVRVADRATRAFDLRLAGHAIAEIAATIGVSYSTVQNLLNAEIERRISPRVEQLRIIETERLDRYLRKLEPAIERGDVKAITTAIRISHRRAFLLGLDSPVRVDAVVTTLSPEDIELQALIREAQARNAAIEGELVAEVGSDDADTG